MNTRDLLDPDVLVAVEQLPPLPALTRSTLGTRRVAYAQLMQWALAQLPPVPGVIVGEHHTLASVTGPAVRLLLHRPAQAAQRLPALLWIHGGGYIDGRAEWDSHLASVLAREVGCCVLAVDYRLAPESPFPAAIEDCYAALAWIHDQAPIMRIDEARIAIGGISAGAGLAAALCLLARDRGELKVSFQCLLQPMLDDRAEPPERAHPYAGEFIWTRAQNHFGWSALLGHEPGGEDVSPYAAAARASCLAGLPPAFIAVGALDLFVEENLEYARRLIRDGVPTELHVFPGACHAFQFLAPHSVVARLHDQHLIAALRRAMAPPVATDPGQELA